jgi:ADP-ribosylglycohydrolase
VLREAERSAAVTHNHAEGIKGAQATALAVFMARCGSSKDEIRANLSRRFGYDLQRTVDEIRPIYQWDVSCQRSVPEAAIAGGIAEAFYKGISDSLVRAVRERLPPQFLAVIDAFEQAFPLNRDR